LGDLAVACPLDHEQGHLEFALGENLAPRRTREAARSGCRAVAACDAARPGGAVHSEALASHPCECAPCRRARLVEQALGDQQVPPSEGGLAERRPRRADGGLRAPPLERRDETACELRRLLELVGAIGAAGERAHAAGT